MHLFSSESLSFKTESYRFPKIKNTLNTSHKDPGALHLRYILLGTYKLFYRCAGTLTDVTLKQYKQQLYSRRSCTNDYGEQL